MLERICVEGPRVTWHWQKIKNKDYKRHGKWNLGDGTENGDLHFNSKLLELTVPLVAAVIEWFVDERTNEPGTSINGR
jgi:hypothetical protein